VKQFKASEWKEGDKVVTRSGHSIRILCVDRASQFCVVGTLMPLEIDLMEWDELGRSRSGMESASDLLIKPKKVIMWSNVFRDLDGIIHFGIAHSSKEKAAKEKCTSRWLGIAETVWEE